MKHYSYFPGCSSYDGGAKAYHWSAKAVAKLLDIELLELEDWNCCGSTPYASIDELASLCVAARNLALAEKTGFDRHSQLHSALEVNAGTACISNTCFPQFPRSALVFCTPQWALRHLRRILMFLRHRPKGCHGFFP